MTTNVPALVQTSSFLQKSKPISLLSRKLFSEEEWTVMRIICRHWVYFLQTTTLFRMDPRDLRESVDSESTLCKSFFQSVYNASTPFNVKNFNVENNNACSAYTSSNDEEQSIYNAVILLKSFTRDAKLSWTLISKWGEQFVDIESTFFKQLYLSEWALENWGNS